jgi:multidrug efflux pump
VTEFASRAAEKVRKQHSLASAVMVFVRTSPFRQDAQYSRSVVVPLLRPAADTGAIVRAAVLGLRAIVSLEVRQYPKTENTVVTVRTPYPGASSELVKGFITTPLQQAIAEADGIDYITSSSKQGLSTIEVYMRLNYDAHAAVAEIQAKVASQRGVLPEQADDPIIESVTGDATSLMYIAFYSAQMNRQQIADYLLRVVRPQLQAIPGVSKAQIFGNQASIKLARRGWVQPSLPFGGLTLRQSPRPIIRRSLNF